MIRISVVVCTYNRADTLNRCLESLVQQSLDKDLYEVILVNNASTDDTPEVLEELLVKHRKYHLVRIDEPRLGLAHARNEGFRYAKGSYVAFMDDDARADKDWLELALDCFEHVKPTPLVVGGPIFPFYEGPKPAWFKDEAEIRTWGETPRFLKNGESFSGSNMIFRREVIEKYGGFNAAVGMKGEYLSVGEETSIFEKIWQYNSEPKVLYYLPQLTVFHAVPNYKLTVPYRLKRAFATGQAWNLRHGHKSLRRRLQLLMGILVSIARVAGSALRQRKEYPAYQNWIIERLAPVAVEIGRLAGCLGLFIPVRQRPR